MTTPPKIAPAMARRIEIWPVERLVPYARNARTHSDDQIAQIAASIAEFGWTNPILVGPDGVLIAGHARLAAAQRLKMTEVPVIVLEHLTESQRRALVLADNKLALNAGWDEETLRAELEALSKEGFDLDIVGFTDEEIEALLHGGDDPDEGLTDEDAVPEPLEAPVSRRGDLWILGEHRLLCGDSASAGDVDRLVEGAAIDLVNTDPPYNVRVEPRPNNAIAAGLSSFAGLHHHQSFDVHRGASSPIVEEAVRKGRWCGSIHCCGGCISVPVRYNIYCRVYTTTGGRVKRSKRLGIGLRWVALILISAGPAASAQDITVEWKAALADLEQRLPGLPADGPAVSAWRADAESLRSSIASKANSYAGVQVRLPEMLPAQPSHEQLEQQLHALSAAVDQIIRQSPGSPFNLGTVQVTVSAAAPTISPVADSIDQTEIQNLNLVNAAKALDYLPGVSIQHLSANRNEAGILVRGFSTRGQVPLYVDGVPISVPYDGYVDFNRFLTSDIAELQVAKGYSSPLLGPNALGGTINLVTQEPTKKADIDALIGTGTGNTLLSALRLGSRWRRFFFQGSLDWLQSDFIPLSGNFPVVQYRNLPDIIMTDHLNNSWSRDERFTGRVGWTPRGQDEYVFSYINLKGQKGVPLYQGPNTAATYRFFWTWPYWDMANYYFHSNTQIGERSAIKLRAFYTQFRNDIDMYSNDTYSVMNTRNAEHSMYDEHNDGFSSEFTTRALSRNVVSASFFLKGDTHTEHGIFPAISPFPLIEPTLRDSDIQTTIGFQDVVKVSSRFSLTGGFSADHFDGLQGQQYNAAMTALLPFTCLASPQNSSFSGCTAHLWNFNPQVAASYRVGESGNFFATFADRGRFPMLKDIYSASLGAGLPNPNLQPEHSRNWNLGYSQIIGTRTLAQVTLFRSDLRNAIESVYVTDPGGTNPATASCPNSRVIGFCSEMANIGSEVHQGVEFEIRSAPLARLTLNASYSFLNRTIAYDFGALPNVSAANTSISILPVLPKNKAIGTAVVRLPRQILGIVNERYEGGLVVQDTTYPATSPLFLPRSEAYATTDIGLIAPIRAGISVQAGVKNLFDRYYFYTAGYPEIGRNWYLNFRYRF